MPDVERDEAVDTATDGELVLPIPVDVEIDEARAALGEQLFYDTALSHDGLVSCTSCHDIERHGGADGNVHSALAGRPPGPVNVPTVLNVGLNFRWSWVGRWELMADQIDAAMRAPHAMATETDDALPGLAQAGYGPRFAAIYDDGLTAANLRDALTEYLRSLTTPNARFDRWLRGDESALTEQELRGWEDFRSFGCVTCHQGVSVGGNLYQRFGVFDDHCANGPGLANFTHNPDDEGVFRVPSLRNVELTAPYFHDGRAATLEDAVQTMARCQLGRSLTSDQVHDLVAFLRTLTGEIPARRAHR
jgi:cytochrome c peroxidase